MADSTTAKALADRVGVGAIKHMQIRFLWIQQQVQQRHLRIEHVPSKLNPADFLTKAIAPSDFDKHLRRIGLEWAVGATPTLK